MAEEEKEEKKKSNLMPIIIGAVGGIVLLLAGLGLGFFLFSSTPADPSEEVDEIIEKSKPEDEEGEEECINPVENAEGEIECQGDPEKVALETPETQVFLTTYFEFPGNFTTNLMNSRKFLQISLGVSTQYDDRVMTNVDAHQLALRSEILGAMSEFTEERIQGKKGRHALANALKDIINEKLEKLESFGGIDEVHFTSFVLQ